MTGCTDCKHYQGITSIDNDLYEVVCDKCDDIQVIERELIIMDCDDWEEAE